MGCLEGMITIAKTVLLVAFFIFIPIYIIGTGAAVASGAVRDPYVMGIILFYFVVIIVAGKKISGG